MAVNHLVFFCIIQMFHKKIFLIKIFCKKHNKKQLKELKNDEDNNYETLILQKKMFI